MSQFGWYPSTPAPCTPSGLDYLSAQKFRTKKTVEYLPQLKSSSYPPCSDTPATYTKICLNPQAVLLAVT